MAKERPDQGEGGRGGEVCGKKKARSTRMGAGGVRLREKARGDGFTDRRKGQ